MSRPERGPTATEKAERYLACDEGDADPPYWLVRDDSGRIPDEHYCPEHLISEAAYLEKHRLKDSGDIWVLPVLDEEDEGWGQCDAEPATPSAPTAGAVSETRSE